MATKCENTLTIITQDRENYLALRNEIQQTYENKLIWETSAFGVHTLRMTFFSVWVFPLHVFQTMTSRQSDPTLQIKVFSREESMDYVGHFRFQTGCWQMKPLDWEDVPPEDLTHLGVTVTFSRRYDYAEPQMTRRLGHAPSTYKELRLYEAKMLAWEDLRKEFRCGKIAPERKSFIQNAVIHKPAQPPTEAISE